MLITSILVSAGLCLSAAPAVRAPADAKASEPDAAVLPPALLPVHLSDHPDPLVLALDADGNAITEPNGQIPVRWLSFATGGPDEQGRAFRLLESTDCITWTPLPNPLAPRSGSYNEFWAPEVAQGDDGKFYFYYANGTFNDGKAFMHLRVAVSEDPVGPYVDAGGPPLVDPAKQPFAIDAHPYKDPNGTWWLYVAEDYPQEGEDARGKVHAGTALAVAALETMTKLGGPLKTVLRAHHEWTIYEKNRAMPVYGIEGIDWHTIEGAFVRFRNGKYWLTYSGAAGTSDRYGVDFAVADSPDGEFVGDSPTAPRVLSTAIVTAAAKRAAPDVPQDKLPTGPGHHSIFVGPDGQDWIAFHAWNPEHTARQMHICPLVWTARGPRVNLATSVSPAALDDSEDARPQIDRVRPARREQRLTPPQPPAKQ